MRTLVLGIGRPLDRYFDLLFKRAGKPRGCGRYEEAMMLQDFATPTCGLAPCPGTAFPSKAQRRENS